MTCLRLLFAAVFILLPAIAGAQQWASYGTISAEPTAGRICTGDTNGKDIVCASPAPYVDASGNVGIGTTSPRARLNIYGSGQTTASIDTTGDLSNMLLVQGSNIAGGDGGGILFGNRTVGGQTDGLFAAIKSLLSSGTGNSIGDLAFSTRTSNAATTLTEKLRITASGNVGIGTTSPGARLDISASGTSGIPALLIGADDSSTTRTDATQKTARIGISHYLNSEEPFTLTYASSSAATNMLSLGGGTNNLNAATVLTFYTAANTTTLLGSERMRIDPAGNVGIGTASPAVKLDVVGTMRVADNADTCTTAADKGKFRYNSSTGKFQICR